ncbi:transketolase family protein [Candidatus Nomurabacteria bacterium]|nr:transketolase family protein [Candidatus Nomurabacteria bacterium]
MINPKLKLNPKIGHQDIEQVPIRFGYGEGLLKAGEENKNVVALCADLTESTRTHLFAKKFPERFIQIGVAEQNLASVASGMAAMGKIPFITSYAMFSPGRNWEQIRTTIAYNNVPVKIAGSHAGVSVGPDGGTHQALEDIAITRVIPRMVVISPCDSIEAKKATIAVSKTKDPSYIRLAREKTPVITTEETPFEIGKAQTLFSPDGKLDATIIATGSLVYRAILVAQSLSKGKINVAVINLSTIKPLDEKTILESVKRSNAVVTVEEHQIFGGMGSAVSEMLSVKYPVPIEFIGMKDLFGQSGKPDELIKFYEMDERSIERAVIKVISRK